MRGNTERCNQRNHLTETRVRIALSGETHPKAAESINGLAAIAYLRGDNQRAEANWAKLADIERHLLDSKHPELAATLSNLGRA